MPCASTAVDPRHRDDAAIVDGDAGNALYTIDIADNRNRTVGSDVGHYAIAEFVEHYHGERNHQGLANELIESAPAVDDPVGRIRRRQRLGGLLNYYYRAA